MLHVATAYRIGFGILALLTVLISIPRSIKRLWSFLIHPAARPTSKRGALFQIVAHLAMLAMGISCALGLGFMAIFAQTPSSDVFSILILFLLGGIMAFLASTFTGQPLW